MLRDNGDNVPMLRHISLLEIVQRQTILIFFITFELDAVKASLNLRALFCPFLKFFKYKFLRYKTRENQKWIKRDNKTQTRGKTT